MTRIAITIDNAAKETLEKLGDQVALVVVAATSDMFNEITDAAQHPIDTGFARASWWSQVNFQPGSNPSQPAEGSGGEPSFNFIEAINGAKIGATISIVNNASYIRDLEYNGTSPQNVGWVNRAAARFPDFVQQRIAEVSK